MTQERKDQLYDQMIAWICEHIKNDEALFLTLHGRFGMTKEELHDHCIDSLDSFFSEDNPRTLLKRKVMANYEEFKAGWLQMEPSDLIAQCAQIEGVTRMMQILPSSVSDEDAQYLIHEWLSRNSMESLVVDDEMSHLLWSLRDHGDTEQFYEMEPEFSDGDEAPALSI